MLAITVDLLADRYTATEYNDRERAEWPPHPARLFMAMVAAWADADAPDPAERAALRWLEQQAPPAIAADDGDGLRRRTVVTHYVPGNDARALSRDIAATYAAIVAAETEARETAAGNDQRRAAKAERRLRTARDKARDAVLRAATATGAETPGVAKGVLESLPERRNRQPRTFPTVIPDRPRVVYMWPDAEGATSRRAPLDRLLGRVARLGHSSTLVSCRLDDDPPPPTLRPGCGRTSLRVPATGMLARLEQEYARHGGREPRRLAAGSESYGPVRATDDAATYPLLGGDWLVLRIASADRLSLTRTLDVTRAVRAALLAHGEQPSSPFISGHAPAPQLPKPVAGPHLAVVPLANVGHPHSDGGLRGIALVLPRAASDEDVGQLRRALQAWADVDDLMLRLPALPGRQPLALQLEDLGIDPVVRDAGADWVLASVGRTLRRFTWCRPARRWVSVTPVALDRHPKHLRDRDLTRREHAEREAAEIVGRACVHAGLPAPIDVEITADSRLVTVPAASVTAGTGPQPARRFPPYAAGSSGMLRPTVHVVLRFPYDVAGPVLVGAGRYHGYGLCLPPPMGRDDRAK